MTITNNKEAGVGQSFTRELSSKRTPEALAGKLYVYRDEDGFAASINRWRVGPNGGLSADGLARIAVPGHFNRATQDELQAYALKFAAVDDLYEALSHLADILEHECECPPCVGSDAPAEHWLGTARAALTLASGAPK
jgi:hypothetical protein